MAEAIKAANRTAPLNYSRCVGGATVRVDQASLRGIGSCDESLNAAFTRRDCEVVERAVAGAEV